MSKYLYNKLHNILLALMNSTVIAVIYIYIPSNKLVNIFKCSILIGRMKITIDVVEKRLIQWFLYIPDYK